MALELALQREADSRREERLYWILVCTIFFDVATFPHLSWIAVVCVFLLEVVTLLGLARRLGNEYVVILMERLFLTICDKIGLERPS